MAIRSSEYLKGKFENGDRPTGTDFADFVDSTLNSSVTSLSAGNDEKLRIFSDGVSAVGNLYTTGDLLVNGATGQTTTVSVSTNEGGKTLTFTNGLLTGVASV